MYMNMNMNMYMFIYMYICIYVYEICRASLYVYMYMKYVGPWHTLDHRGCKGNKLPMRQHQCTVFNDAASSWIVDIP